MLRMELREVGSSSIYWDTQITFQRSCLARLNYVRQNPVHHGVVHKASEYHWCSAAGFERSARAAFVKGRAQVSDGSDPCEGLESGGMPPHSTAPSALRNGEDASQCPRPPGSGLNV